MVKRSSSVIKDGMVFENWIFDQFDIDQPQSNLYEQLILKGNEEKKSECFY